MNRRSWSVGLLALSVSALAACTGLLTKESEPEKLFFAMKIEGGGQLLARPHLLGETGHKLSMRLVDPSQPAQSRLALELFPERDGEGYRLQLGVALADAEPQLGALSLMHAEERRLKLDGERPLLVTVMLMRVDSPEFEAWMELVRREQATQSS